MEVLIIIAEIIVLFFITRAAVHHIERKNDDKVKSGNMK